LPPVAGGAATAVAGRRKKNTNKKVLGAMRAPMHEHAQAPIAHGVWHVECYI
jgi:hypothetical protein